MFSLDRHYPARHRAPRKRRTGLNLPEARLGYNSGCAVAPAPSQRACAQVCDPR